MPNHSSKMDTSGKVEVHKNGTSQNVNSYSHSKRSLSNTDSAKVENLANCKALVSSSTNEELASLFECPVCFDYVLPPIMQCQNGHLVCQTCLKMVQNCPTCRIQISNNIRNLQMEKLACNIQFPCKYSNSGCKMLLLYKDKCEHEESCLYKPYSCPCPGLFLFNLSYT